MSAGHVRRRGEGTWELKFDAGRDPATRKRKTRYASFKGTKRQAEQELARLVTAAASGSDVEPSRLTVSAFLDRWERDWMVGNVSPKTAERYSEILKKHVRARIGSTLLQKVRPATLADLYGTLQREGKAPGQGLAARTVGHVHRVIHRALGHAAQWGLVAQNVADLVDPPRVMDEEIEIIGANALRAVLAGITGRSIELVATLALATGMRRGELMALRWGDVDLDRAIVRVERSLEVTRQGLRFKSPKTKHGRRPVTLPSSAVAALRAHRKVVQERRLALGTGKIPAEELVLGNWDGTPRHPDRVTKEWARAMDALGMPGITFHALRHTHVSHLIAAGLDILTISRRIGHGSAAITLRVYGHLFTNPADRAASIMDETFAAAGRTE